MLRIVAGKLGGRRIQAPPGKGTRPTSEKVRGALFNALEQWLALDGARVVDLYAGSGALGIEALSRGAAHVIFVEDDHRSAATIRGNLKDLDVPRAAAEVLPQKVLTWLRRAPADPPTQLVLLDPPYAAGEYAPALAALVQWPGLGAGALLVVETSKQLDLPVPPGLELLRSRRYGDTQLVFLRKLAPASDAAEPAAAAR